jgi:hypothetical protein
MISVSSLCESAWKCNHPCRQKGNAPARYESSRFFNGYWEGDRGRFEHDHGWDRDPGARARQAPPGATFASMARLLVARVNRMNGDEPCTVCEPPNQDCSPSRALKRLVRAIDRLPAFLLVWNFRRARRTGPFRLRPMISSTRQKG